MAQFALGALLMGLLLAPVIGLLLFAVMWAEEVKGKTVIPRLFVLFAIFVVFVVPCVAIVTVWLWCLSEAWGADVRRWVGVVKEQKI